MQRIQNMYIGALNMNDKAGANQNENHETVTDCNLMKRFC